MAEYNLLSVIVPVYNEHNTVAEIVRRIRGVDLPLDLEVVVVDDGSTDGTGQVLSLLEDSTLRVVSHPENQGKAATVRTGLAHARGQLILIQDADLEYDPADWPRLLDPVLKGKARVVYGSRFRGERMTMPLQRWVSNRVLAVATSLMYNRTVSDVETCYKLFDRSVLDRLRLTSERFDIEAELTAKVLRLGYGIYEVPISFSGRALSEGKKFTGRDSVRALRALVRYRFSPREG
ncbi:MAG TPA: glycosyltransferase family 2 protein [Acidimicrobiales bacterium]|nr:glycosyltransferase family 2 protein [Acidimicrobiales bacterium]